MTDEQCGRLKSSLKWANWWLCLIYAALILIVYRLDTIIKLLGSK